ncbi:lamin tail domain-containing protein [Patescibacteria group bacterium]|nr:lamin tail domain-containing protein [Patescibacteria group bacterium]
MRKSFIAFVAFLFLFTLFCRADTALSVIINEIAWMGTQVSYADEWIELYNNTNAPLNLDGWVLKAKDGTLEINLTGTIRANGFFLLERTNDDTLPNVLADQIYTGALRNKGENLEIYDNLGNLIDSVNCSSSWFAGDNQTKQTMERKKPELSGSDLENWQTSQNPGGTPKTQNSVVVVPPPEELITESQEEPKEKSKPILYPSDIFINEILPSPEGPDDKEEWIEIFNENNFEVDLSGWKIKDTSGKVKTYTLPEGTKIGGREFLVLKRPITKITLNNDGGGLNLIQPDGKIIGEISYERASYDQSYNRTESGWIWNSTLTPGSPSISPTPISEPGEEIKEEKTQEFTGEKELAAVSKQIPKEFSSFLPLLIAFGVAIFSGIIILILKRKIKPKNY